MSVNNDAGHARNVANFGILYSRCAGYGAVYNPSNTGLSLNALSELQNASASIVGAFNAAIPAYKNATASREGAFKPLAKLVTRVVNALKAAKPNAEILEKTKSVVRKLQGQRTSAKLTEEEKKELTAQGKEINEISASQQGFDSRLDNLDKLINLLASIPEYNPNEADLQVSSLTALLEDLKARNREVVDSTTQLSNARISRNNILYQADFGLVDIALGVKSYVKSVFGSQSPQYKQISGLKFVRYTA